MYKHVFYVKKKKLEKKEIKPTGEKEKGFKQSILGETEMIKKVEW